MMSTPRALLTSLAVLALAGCGNGADFDAAPNGESAAPARGTSPLESTFEAAAAEYQVPVDVLKGIAYVETRVQSPGHRASMTGGYGTMNLVEREDWQALQRGAELTATDRGLIKLDERANIRAAAAFLRELADRVFPGAPDLNPHDVGDWFQVVSLYPGIDSHPVSADYAAQVFTAIDEGFEVTRDDGTVVQAPTHYAWLRHQPLAQKKDAVKEYPGAYQWKASPNYTNGRSQAIQYVIIHTVQGSYAGCISWFQNSASNVSAHYVVRSSDGQVTQMVEHADTAWHASCYNSKSIGIEHEGYVNNPSTWYTNAMYSESAKLTQWITNKHGIPKTRSRIIGHVEVPSACNGNGHYDPGTGWNWTKYMQLVTGSSPTPTTGVLKGVIYTGGSTTNRVSGATVTVNGKTAVTGTTGEYTFTLAPGTYTVSVSKSGWTTKSLSRTVTAGTTVWGSMEINPVASKGTLKGTIYKNGNTADRVAGATVSIAGQAPVTTGTDGLYSFSLNPGTYTVTVTKSGYSTNSVSRTVVASTTVWGSMEINPVANPGTVKGAIYQNGDTANRVAGVTVSVAGTSQSMTTGTDGLYTFNLAPGTYTLNASKSGYQNASVTRTISSGTTIWGSMELKSGTPTTTDTTPPTVGITFPGDGAALDLAQIELTGTASDDKGAIAEVSLKINDGTPAKVAVTGGAFTQLIQLFPGLNTIEVSATDAAGNTTVDSVQATFRAGITGFVHLHDDEASRIPDVTVKILDVDSGAEVATTTSGQDGTFNVDLMEVGRDYLMVASAAGFVTHAETISVPAEERLQLALPLTQGEDPVPSEVKIEFIDPKDGATVTTDSVTVYGSVGGFQVITVTVNGVSAELVGAGGFAATVPLAEGANSIEAIATGMNGETITGTLTIHRQPAETTTPGGDDGSGGGTDAVKGSCAALPGLELLALFAVAPLLRRRRR